MKTSKLVWMVGLSLQVACGGGDDGGGDTNAMTIGMTLGGSGGDDDGSGGAGSSSGGTAADDGADDGSTAAPDDGMMDDGADDAAACNPPCAAGQECIAGQCFGGDESTGEPPADCGTNVMFPNAMCDECAKASCCEQMQACFGDETVMEATPCFTLNNCIAMSCTMATNAMELQTCIDENCAENADQLNTWLAFQNCVGTSCMAQCAGG